LFQCLKFQTS